MEIKGIETRDEKERRQKRNRQIGSIILLLILVLSTLGFAFLSGSPIDSGNSDNNNPEVEKLETDKISFNYAGENFNLLSSYLDVKNVSINFTKNIGDYANRIIYVDSKNDGISQELGLTIGKFAARMQKGCYGKCEENLPERNCTDDIIVWREFGENRVYQNESCIFIDGDMKTVDAFIYNLFGRPE